MLAEQYYEVETPNEAQKPVTQVRFNADYDITDICTRFGNWSRLGLYLKQNTPSYYHSQPKRFKEICTDDDAKLINAAFLDLLRLNVPNSKDIYDILILFYFGEKQAIQDYITTDGCVRDEIARLAKGIHGAPLKGVSKGIRKEKVYIVKPLSVRDISKKLEMNWNAVDKLKKSGEDFLNGYFLAMAKVGTKLELMQSVNF